VLGGGRGAFEASDHITSMLTLAPDGAPLQPMPRQAFLGEMRALLKFTE
jgi:hypothetical protein